jgi:hypothetical protein
MKRSKIFIIITCFILVAAAFACKKSFLTQKNTFQGTVDGTFNKPEDVIALVNSIYDTYQNSDLLKKCIWYRANFGTHDFFNWGGDVFWNNYQIPATFGGVSTLWNQSYVGIGRANAAFNIITKAVDKGILTLALANRLRGETYFLRGMTFYYLAASFGGVPVETDTSGNVNLGLRRRDSRDSVFKQVVADMQAAEGLLVSKTALPVADLGRATKGAAFAYEGAARMWLKDYTGALAAFNNAELTSNYHLMANFADANEYNKQNNDESLFEIQFAKKAGDPQDWGGSWNPPGGELGWIDSFSWPEEVTQQGYDYGNPALWNSYQEGDKRKLLTIVGPGDSLASPGIIAAWGGIKGYPPVVAGFASGDAKYKADNGTILNTVGTLTRPWYGSDGGRTGYFCSKKWRDPNLTGNYGNPAKIFGDQNQILMRYSEVILSRAECKVRTNDIPGAMADLKVIRDRAWGGVAPAIMKDSANYDGTPGVAITDPLQMVLSEYRHELSGEYSVFFNLCRAGTTVAIDFIKKANGTVDASYEPVVNPAAGPTHDNKKHGLYNTSLTVDRALLPIPQSAIALNPNLTQNPGY